MADVWCSVRKIQVTGEWEFACTLHGIRERYVRYWRAVHRMKLHMEDPDHQQES